MAWDLPFCCKSGLRLPGLVVTFSSSMLFESLLPGGDAIDGIVKGVDFYVPYLSTEVQNKWYSKRG